MVTLDPINKGNGAVLSNNNMTVMIPNGNNTAKATVGKTSGKWYWEVTMDILSNATVSIINSSANVNGGTMSTTNSRGYYSATGTKWESVTAQSYGEPYVTGDVIGTFLDMDSGTITWYKNGVSQGVAFTNVKLLGEVFPAITSGSSTTGLTATFNFGATSFKYTPSDLPSGTRAYSGNRIGFIEEVLLSKNNKGYSTHIEDTWYETNMTSNTAPIPLIASASSQFNASYAPFKAFNAILSGETNSWVTSSGVNNGWIQINFNKQVEINMFSITSGDYASSLASEPKDFTLYGSNDGVTFDKLITINSQTDWKLGETRTYLLNKDAKYSIFKLQVNNNNGFSYLRIAELKFGYKKRELIEIAKIDKDAFVKYGKDSFDNLDADFIMQTYVLNDGAKNKQLTKKPLSIRFD